MFPPSSARTLEQDEASLLCRVASQHDLADTFQLRSTEGWQNLQAILQSSGERLPKRRREHDSALAAALRPSSLHKSSPASDTGEPLAKRFAAFRLNERRPINELSPPDSTSGAGSEGDGGGGGGGGGGEGSDGKSAKD